MDSGDWQQRKKGRGAISNREGRFEAHERLVMDDGWDGLEDLILEKPKTTVTVDASKSVLTRNDSPDVPFDRSVNMYRGCEHGCIYCFARPTHSYLGLSPGMDFETRLFYKPDAADILRHTLAHPKYEPATIGLGTNTDPYQPIEKEYQLTRRILETLAEFNHPVSIITKNMLVMRDMDILGPMADKGLASVMMSVTTLDHRLANVMEPRASTPNLRLKAVKALTDRGVPTGVLVAPVIPGLTDHEVEVILQAAHDHGARYANYILLRLPMEVADIFEEWLSVNYPERKDKVMGHMRAMRGGDRYRAEFGNRMRGTGVEAQLLSQRFKLMLRKLGMDQRQALRKLDISLFKRPHDPAGQMHLF